MTENPRWKLKIKELSRWTDFRSMLGWNWEWSVREFMDSASPGAAGYWAPGLYGWHGRSRTREHAIAYVEQAREYFTRPPKTPAEEVWYVD